MREPRPRRETFRLSVGEADMLAHLADALKLSKTDTLVLALEALHRALTEEETT